MSENQSSRRKFLQMLGLSAGATFVAASSMAKGFDQEEIRKLTAPQQEFMMRYEKWMNEYIDVIRIQKTDPDNIEHHKSMAALSAKAEAFQPELAIFMKDETFAMIFQVSIERMTKEI